MSAPSSTSAQAHPFHLLAKPAGAKCNLRCRYCFFLEKESLYPGSKFRMSADVQEQYVRQTLESQAADVCLAWQGGEPTLMGLPFFRRSVELGRRYARPGQNVSHHIQTNGTLLDDDWCDFLRENNFLVGVSLDGPRRIHDAYRVDAMGRPTFDGVMRGVRLLQKHAVDFNILAAVHAANQDAPLEVYRFFRDEVGTDWVQFIPIVERMPAPDGQAAVTPLSVRPEAYGRFLIAVFDEWVRRDVGRMFVQDFEVALRCWVGLPPMLCVHSPVCGDALALEHNGDVYACDHFVSPGYLLGNLMETPLAEIVTDRRQRVFGDAKRDTLPAVCRACDVRFACQGGCPKDRFAVAPEGDPNLNYLCDGYAALYGHIDAPMRLMAGLLAEGRPADSVMSILARQRTDAAKQVGRNDPCPCGSGRKFKKCCATET